MDIMVDAAPQAPAVRHQMRFEGSGGEYFKIWIVNLALSIVTLGIFSAWAKVRSKRYFYGNTYIGEHNFDYHADPIRILIGRAIAFVALLSYSLASTFAPLLAALLAIGFFFAMPWLVNAALRFNARNSSYRNIRFNFVGGYGDAFRVYIGWAFLLGLTLFTTYPLAKRARIRFNIDNHRFGGQPFNVEITGRALYSIYAIGLVIFLGFVIGATVIAGAVGTIAGASVGTAAKSTGMGAFSIWHILILVLFAFIPLVLVPFVGTKVFNLAASGTTLAERFHFESSLSPLYMTWLAFSNLLLMLVTLGLFYPWARVRTTRYTSSHFAVTGDADIGSFTSELVAAQGAIGEEVANFFDVDIGF